MTYSQVSRPPAAGFEFVAEGYALLREPLNLLQEGQQWFCDVYRQGCDRAHPWGLVLGATPWLGRLLAEDHGHVTLVDINPAMLHIAQSELSRYEQSPGCGQVELREGNWLALPQFSQGVGVVAGDNSFAFLEYPAGWMSLLQVLSERMPPGATLIARFLSPPASHTSKNIDQVIEEWVARDSVNWTELRTALLFSHWNPVTCVVETEKAVDTFDKNRAKFDVLFDKFPLARDNDLLTIRKYKKHPVLFSAPPLGKIFDLLAPRFRVISVHFGPYGMSQYFPLIVARRTSS